MSDKIKELLELLEKETQHVSAFTTTTNDGKPSDRALWHLLKQWESKLPELDDYFHKAFRQVDVTDDGHTDMAIWNLLSDSTLFWRLFERVQEEKKVNKEEDEK